MSVTMPAINPYANPQAMPREAAPEVYGWPGRLDWPLILISLTLAGIGLVMVASSSVAIAERLTGDPLYYFWRQLAHAVLGLALAGLVMRIPTLVWHRLGPVLLLIGMVVLALVLVPGIGHEVNGSVRWLRFGPIGIQPSEGMKLALAMYMAGYLVRKNQEVRESLSGFLKPISVLVIIAALLLFEPDYGTTAVLFAMALGMLFMAGVPLVSFGAWAALVGVAMSLIVVAAPYRVERLMSFLNPWADPFNTGFQLTQALIAIGRGEAFGVGLGHGVQKLFYLPEAHTDFLFAVMAEELGFVAVALVILLYAAFAWRSLSIARMAQANGHFYGAYLASGLGLLIALQALVNIGVNLGALPTKGITLPLMSYGGTSLVANCVAVGLLVRVAYEARRKADD